MTGPLIESREPPADAAEHVRRRVLHMIELGRVPAGGRLPSAAELSTMLGVSRPTALQALKTLEDEGRLIIRRGGGTWVAPLTADNIDARRAYVWQRRSEIVQMSAIREILESGVARLLAQTGLNRTTVSSARGLLKEMRESPAREAYRHMDTQFHETLVGACAMPLLQQTLFDARTSVTPVFEFLPWPEDRQETCADEHERLLEAIIARDPDTAAGVAREHVALSGRLISEVLDQDSSIIFTLPKDLPVAQG